MSQESTLRRTIQAISLVAILALVLALGLHIFGDEPSNEEQIEAAIHQVAEGAENADIAMCMEPFSERYSDPDGLDRKSIQGVLWQHFRKRGPISVWLGSIVVQIEGSQATATFDVGLVEGSEGTAVPWPTNADALSFTVDLALEPEGWRIISHTQQPLIPAD